ncbi:hypothetical protein [Kribbella speibonae]|uniref:Uncharacterized protein n=1 Tax=Kribbella speibonae TaxID=1572660 RepID=A0ABY2AAD9_9ACTN|nr:hypothetical protein [Kribbella speibonae]TCC24969.1 hypothetical protein E0H58_12300 [Kribbella speibonae]
MTVWMLDKSEEWVAGAESETGQSSDAVWASQLVSDDLMRWSRWWLGLGAFVVAFFAAGTAGTLGMLLVLDGAGFVVVGILVVAVAVAALAGCGVVLWRLHRSGRRLARALRWWLGLRAVAVPRRGFAGWLAPRAVLFKPVVFVRVLTATLSGLIGIFGLSMIGYSVTQEAVLLLASILWGLLGTACCIGQLGGVMRLVSGLADDDPLWSTVG